VIPHFKGEIGINVDVLQLAHRVYERTERIRLGSAVMNILCNGGPIAHAERVRYFLTLNATSTRPRGIEIGFAAGRFPFINVPYGIVPRTPVEAAAWPVLKGLVFRQATEVFLRLVKGEVLSSDDLEPITLAHQQFRTDEDWARVLKAHGRAADSIIVPSWWTFPYLQIVPKDAPLELLRLTLGSHDPAVQIFANRIMPVGVFNLSITSGAVIEETNRRMLEAYHPDGGPWQRSYMPRTALVYINEDRDASPAERRRRATEEARHALGNYWAAMEGTLDPKKVENAVDNALVGDGATIIEQIRERFDADDRLMLWFDFNDHDSAHVVRKMELFMEHVAPAVCGAPIR
jgi:alkanesulfonate monooxygenase SsuD/methylene tetrahydromethanopterin reductase-like flavin-dependent oxidoreductase (luciferase family)